VHATYEPGVWNYQLQIVWGLGYAGKWSSGIISDTGVLLSDVCNYFVINAVVWLLVVFQGGDLIASLELDDPSAVRKALPFEDGFPPLGLPTARAAKVHQRCADGLSAARNVLAGYQHDVDEVLTCMWISMA
jgi:hypothetical protein